MKSFTTKLSTLVLCAFVMSSSVFAGGKTNVHISIPNDMYIDTNDNDSYSGKYEGKKDINIIMTPSNDSHHASVIHYGYSLMKNGKKLSYFEESGFRGYPAWNWKVDKDYNVIREALDNNGTVLCREVNGKVQPGAISNHDSDTTCARKHS